MLRKTKVVAASCCLEGAASMRPQRNAAENARVSRMREQRVPASMRPQRNAAENAHMALYVQTGGRLQ